MHITGLQLKDFRSWANVSCLLEPGVTVFFGSNGHGKTNLVEAINYAATLGSHRVASDTPLIKSGSDHARVSVTVAEASSTTRETRVEVSIYPGRANSSAINGVKTTKLRDVVGLVRTVLFAPEDLALVKGDPSERRRFLDELLVSRQPRYAGVLSDFSRVLKQRSSLLKSAPGVPRRADAQESLLATLDVWDHHFSHIGAAVLAGRLRILSELRSPVIARHSWVCGETSQDLTLTYKAYGTACAQLIDIAELPSEDELQTALTTDLKNRRSDELRRGVCLVGPQRDDLEISLNNGPAKSHASQGEAWSIALALKLGSFDVLAQHEASEPVLLLDDVFSVLDEQRRHCLTQVVCSVEQAIITTAALADVPVELRERTIDVDGLHSWVGNQG